MILRLQTSVTDGLEAAARPGEVDRPVRETNIPALERTISGRAPAAPLNLVLRVGYKWQVRNTSTPVALTY